MEEEISLRDIILVLWKRKWIIVIIPVIAAIAAFLASQFMTPTYESSTTIALGNFSSDGNDLYTNPNSAKEVILSADTLRPIRDKLQLDYERIKSFRESITVEAIPNTRMVTITASYSDPKVAQEITQALAQSFMEQSNKVYQEKRGLIEGLLSSLQKQYDQTGESLNRNKAALTAVETNTALSNAEKDITRSRLIDYVVKDENMLTSLTSQIQGVQSQLLDMDNGKVVESANLPRDPVSPKPLLNTVIAIVVGLMMGVFIAFIMEYFANNPIRSNQTPNHPAAQGSTH
jgi:capsular polysaccharide biosynthesis protein